MAATQFQLRFKDKLGIVTKHGDFSTENSDCDGSPMVNTIRKPGERGINRTFAGVKTQTFTRLAQEAEEMQKKVKKAVVLPEIRENAPLYMRSHPNHRSASSLFFPHLSHASVPLANSSFSQTSAYHPYSLKDFKLLKPPQRLGGLGPVTIGSEDWEADRKKRIRRQNYRSRKCL